MKVFLIDGKEVAVAEEKIRQYYNLGPCFKHVDGNLVRIQGSIYIDEEGTLCDCENCTNEISQLLGEDGLPLEASLDFSTMESTYGFIYDNKLQKVAQLALVAE